MTTGEVMAIATVIGSLFSVFGITGIDANLVSQGVSGFISFVTLIAAMWTFMAHRKAVVAAQ